MIIYRDLLFQVVLLRAYDRARATNPARGEVQEEILNEAQRKISWWFLFLDKMSTLGQANSPLTPFLLFPSLPLYFPYEDRPRTNTCLCVCVCECIIMLLHVFAYLIQAMHSAAVNL